MKLEQKTVCSTWGTNLPRTSKQQRSAVTAIIKSLNRQMPVPGLVQDTGDTGLNLEPENKQAPGVRGMGRPRSLHQPAAQEPPGQPEQARQGEHTDGLPVRPASHPGAPPAPLGRFWEFRRVLARGCGLPDPHLAHTRTMQSPVDRLQVLLLPWPGGPPAARRRSLWSQGAREALPPATFPRHSTRRPPGTAIHHAQNPALQVCPHRLLPVGSFP
uniref:uncharacterized protein LOC120887573 isoform X10 n=1 Tax=Ictidomys tridecemlineatus TaxID=43179 RepID=UPI001A9F0CBB|nr:uncharacterized protein LOC120887573 isoform X10 [Ictidomys tridecemlineatus]